MKFCGTINNVKIYLKLMGAKMNKEMELKNFKEKAEDLISSSYLLAEVKIVNLLKVIASSDTICALFKSCLTDFDYVNAKKSYFVASQYLSNDKKVFVLPESPKDIIAFVFLCLMDIDSKTITLPTFLDTYFYDDGSTYSSYSMFINLMIKPFVSTVYSLAEDIFAGKLQDPHEVLTNIERKKARLKAEKEEELEKEKELSKKSYGENVKKARRILIANKNKFLNSKISGSEKAQRAMVIDELVFALDSEKQDRIAYSFLCHCYMAKAHIFRKQFKVKTIRKLLNKVIYEL